jgi:hypothetical protein
MCVCAFRIGVPVPAETFGWFELATGAEVMSHHCYVTPH